MKGRWLPFLASTAALALAVVAPAQDRSRGRSGGGGGGAERSAPSRSNERSSPPRSSERSAPSRSDQGPRPGAERRDPPRQEPRERPPVGRESSRQNDRPSRPSNGDRPSGGDRPGNVGRPSSGGDRPSNTDRPTRTDYPNSGGNRNPFDRENRVQSNRGNRGGGGGFGAGSGGALGRPLRSHSSRSGVVSYGSISNGYGNIRPTRYGSAPWRGSLNEQIRRTRGTSGYNVRWGTFGGLRIGYVGYSNAWCDDNFAYPYYVFNPWMANGYCVASPWYRYSYLPAYVNTTRVIVVNNYVPTWGTSGWNDYSYDRNDRRNEALNDSLDDLRDAFERNSTRYADRLVPPSGQVAIYNDGRYDYSIGADDFRDMFLDGVEQSKTIKYEITEVQTRGDEVHIRARHEYEDSWGERQVVYHTITLRRERGDSFVIREFGTE
jgi:hypothetical protein